MAARQSAGELFAVRERDGRPRFDLEVWNELRDLYADPPETVDADVIELDATLAAIDEMMEVYLRVAAYPDVEMRLDEALAVESTQPAVVASFLLPRLTNAIRVWARTGRHRDATILTAALASYHCRHGAWPSGLDTALAVFAAEPLRRDHFGHDFVYRAEDGSGPWLYAVGRNRSDDGGAATGDPPLDEVYLRPR
jgi:hypothetical protein